MIRWLLNLINGRRNPSNVFTDTPGGINGMTWEQAQEWLDKGRKVKRIGWSDKSRYIDYVAGRYWDNHVDDSGELQYCHYYPTPTDNMPVWYVVKEGQK